MRFKRRQDDAEVVVLHERSGVLAFLPLRFTLQLLDFSVKVEFEKRSSHRRLVWSSMLRVLVHAFSHDFLPWSVHPCK